MATCRRAGFRPDVHHVANSILTQLAMVAAGLGITLAPSTTVRQDAAITHRPLTERAELVELSLVTRAAAPGPLVEQFLQIAINPS
jgi:DNA-binding transcriptional LysR family regulator